MRHFLADENVGLVTCRQAATNSWELLNITKNIVDDSFVSNRTKERGYVFPLYLYPDQTGYVDTARIPNFDAKIVEKIAKGIKLKFEIEKSNDTTKFAPIDLLDYIYAVLHSLSYREKYKEFLKIDFPRVPFPKNATEFWKMVELGGKLRQLHLLENVQPQNDIASFNIKGTMEVEKPKYENGKVWINDMQYFDHIPLEAWEFYIGSYQPAQKWLKDRKGRTLTFEDIRHYQKMIVALKSTSEIMELINQS
jgi:predicted helicase